MKALLLAALLVACGDNDPAPGPILDYRVIWTLPGSSTSIGPVFCMGTISHPCPFLIYARHLTFDVPDGSLLTWSDAAEDTRTTLADQATVDPNGDLTLTQHGDDGGLRRRSKLTREPNGHYQGAVLWTLFGVPGDTMFDLDLEPIR